MAYLRLLGVALLAFQSGMTAAATFWTDAAAFDAATMTVIEDFEVAPFGPAPSLSFDHFLVTESDDSTNAVLVVDTASLPGFDFGWGGGTDVLAYTDVSGASVVSFSGFASDTTAFGVYIASGSPGSVTVTGPDSMTLDMSIDTPIFIGITNADPFLAVSFAYSGSPPAVTFDNARVGTVSAVPLPAGVILFCSVLGVFGLMRRRHHG